MISIAKVRANKGLSQVKLAVRLEDCGSSVSASSIARMEAGKPVSRLAVGRVCEYLGIDINTVVGVRLTGEGPLNPELWDAAETTKVK